jgi:peptidoglycan/xylan/chitin deacetylase (PgdA/CDA1 family)
VTTPISSHAGVALNFDDNNVDAWYAIRGILQSKNAHATFNVAFYDALTTDQKNELKLLQADGNEIAYHGLHHVDAHEYVNLFGVDGYLNDEIIPGLNLMKADGFNPVTFALPFGSEDDRLTQPLQAYFSHVRNITSEDHPNYYQYGSNQLYVSSIGIDDTTYGVTTTDIHNLIDEAKNEDKIVVFYSHKPVASNPQAYETSYARLEDILDYVSSNNLKTFTMSELH